METKGTVTIPIDRYNQLIEKEKAVDLKQNMAYSYSYSSNNFYTRIYSLSNNELIKKLVTDNEKLKNEIETYKKDIEEIKKMSMFKLYRFSKR